MCFIAEKKEEKKNNLSAVCSQYLWCGSAASGGLSASCAWRAGSGTRPWACWGLGNCPESAASSPPPTPCLGQWLQEKRGWGWGSKVRVAATTRDLKTLTVTDRGRCTTTRNTVCNVFSFDLIFYELRRPVLFCVCSVKIARITSDSGE